MEPTKVVRAKIKKPEDPHVEIVGGQKILVFSPDVLFSKSREVPSSSPLGGNPNAGPTIGKRRKIRGLGDSD